MHSKTYNELIPYGSGLITTTINKGVYCCSVCYGLLAGEYSYRCTICHVYACFRCTVGRAYMNNKPSNVCVTCAYESSMPVRLDENAGCYQIQIPAL